MDKMKARLEKGPTVGQNVFVADNATVIGDVILGDDASIWYGAILRGDVEQIVIGKGSNVQDGSVIHVTKNTWPTILGENVTLGHSVTLHGCVIEDNVLVGIGSVVLDGAVIERDCIIAAGSLVPPGKRMPAGHLIKGNPAQVARKLTPEEIDSITDYANRYKAYKNLYLEKGIK